MYLLTNWLRTESSLACPHDLWLAELAVTGSEPGHRLFALETLFEIAQHDDHMRRLRDLAGSIDLFGVMAINDSEMQMAVLQKALAEFLQSRSWRYTASLRRLRRLFEEISLKSSVRSPFDSLPLLLNSAQNCNC